MRGDNRIGGGTGAAVGAVQNVSEDGVSLAKQPQRSNEYDYIKDIAGV